MKNTRLTCSGKSSDVDISIQNQLIKTDLFLLPSEGCNIDLGARWLRTLGNITWNFSELIMQFILNGKRVIIKGKDVGEVTTVSTHQMERILQNPSETFLVQLREVGSTNLSSVEVRELEVLLSKFLDIFEEPKGLPPKRLHDPRIPLLPGSRAANV